MANKTITLNPSQYSNLIRVIHEERDDIGCQLAEEEDYVPEGVAEVTPEWEEMEQYHAGLCELSQVLYDQCEKNIPQSSPTTIYDKMLAGIEQDRIRREKVEANRK